MSNSKFGIDMLRHATRLFNNCNESFNQEYTAEQLIKIAEHALKCEYDFYPDQWTERQIQECLTEDKTPEFVETNGGIEPKYSD